MSEFINFIESYMIEIVGVSIIIALLSIIFVFINMIRTSSIIRKYKRLMRGVNNKNLEAMLYNHLDTLQTGLTRIKDAELQLTELASLMKGCVQKVGIIRYNAFDKMGGDQSFSVALLDGNGKGVVITGLYGNTSSAAFAKPIINYKSTCRLSPEEEEAIKRASN